MRIRLLPAVFASDLVPRQRPFEEGAVLYVVAMASAADSSVEAFLVPMVAHDFQAYRDSSIYLETLHCFAGSKPGLTLNDSIFQGDRNVSYLESPFYSTKWAIRNHCLATLALEKSAAAFKVLNLRELGTVACPTAFSAHDIPLMTGRTRQEHA